MLSRWLRPKEGATRKTEQPLQIPSTVSGGTPEEKTQEPLAVTVLNESYLPPKDAAEVDFNGKEVEVFIRFKGQLYLLEQGKLTSLSKNTSAYSWAPGKSSTYVHLFLEKNI